MSSLARRTLTGMVWNFGGTALQAVLQVGVVAVLARLLNPQDFGLVAAATVVITFSTIFTQLGIGPALVQSQVADARHSATGFTLSLLIGLAFAAGVWLGAPGLAAAFAIPELEPILKVLAALFPIQATGIVAEALMQRDLRFKPLALIDVISFALGFGVVALVLSKLGYGAWSLVFGQVGQATLKTLLLLIAQNHPKKLGVDVPAARDLLRFGFGFSLAKIFNFVALQGDYALVGRLLGPTALGYYSQAYQFIAVPANLIGTVMDRVLFPAMASIQSEHERIARAFQTSVQMAFVFTTPAAALAIILAPELVGILLGPKWEPVIVPLQVFSASLMFRTAYKMSDSLARAKGAVYRRAWRQALYAAFVLLGVVAGQRWGITGVAWGVAAAITANYAIMSQLSLRLVELRFFEWLKAHVPGLLLGGWVAVAGGAATWACRRAGLPDIATLAAVGVFAGGSALLLAYLMPRVFLGEGGIRCMQLVRDTYLARLSRADTP